MYVLGIDPSLTGTGVVAYDGKIHKFISVTSDPAKGVGPRMARFSAMVAAIKEFIYTLRIDAEVSQANIEGYSFGSKGGLSWDRAEFGGLLRSMLCEINLNVREIAPTSLKKFVSGKGGADKPAMMLACYKRWGVEFEGKNANDLVDAYGLARMAWLMCNLDQCETKPQKTHILSLMSPKAKQKKNREPKERKAVS